MKQNIWQEILYVPVSKGLKISSQKKKELKISCHQPHDHLHN